MLEGKSIKKFMERDTESPIFPGRHSLGHLYRFLTVMFRPWTIPIRFYPAEKLKGLVIPAGKRLCSSTQKTPTTRTWYTEI